MIGPAKLLRPAQQLRQLGDVAGDPSRLIFGDLAADCRPGSSKKTQANA